MTRLVPDQQLVQERLLRSPTSICSLDGFLIGHVMAELNGNITIASSNGDQFILSDCRIISADKSQTNGFVEDIEYHELSKFQTIVHQSGNSLIT